MTLASALRSAAPAAFLAAALCVQGPAHAVDLAPGGAVQFRDSWDASLHNPGTNLATDPSLAGTVVASASRDFTLIVTRTPVFGDPFQFTVTGTLDDWVVRRADTGTLDFYSDLRITAPGSFGGDVLRPWNMAGATQIDAGFRDDLVAGGNAPTAVSMAGDGKSITEWYFGTDEGAPNFISGQSAPVLLRSSATLFTIGNGRLDYSYGSEPWTDGGSVGISFFMPTVPEPATGLLAACGLLVLGAARARRAASGRGA